MNSLDLALNDYIAIRRAVGFELREVAGCLRNFVAFLKILCQLQPASCSARPTCASSYSNP